SSSSRIYFPQVLRGRPKKGPPNVRINARTSGDPRPPSAHPFPKSPQFQTTSAHGSRHRGAALIGPPATRVNTQSTTPTYELLSAATAIRNDQGPPCLERTSQKLTRTASDQPQDPQLGQHV